jgi:hypothetical protein
MLNFFLSTAVRIISAHPKRLSHIPWRIKEDEMAVQPNEYTLKGGGITFTYSTSNFLGQPFATYNDGKTTKDFFGSAIRVQNVGVGTLVTVTTFMTIDTGGTEFSVLLPVMELADATKTQAFNTDGIVTHFKGPDSFPATGVRETYDFIPMTGTARSLKFIVPLAAVPKAG